jgi:hypothetical protein
MILSRERCQQVQQNGAAQHACSGRVNGLLDQRAGEMIMATNIEDYVRSSAETRAAYDAHNRQQAGDPATLGATLVTLASTEKPPLHYAAGSDAVEVILGKITTMRNEIERWRELSVSTDLVVEKHCNKEV